MEAFIQSQKRCGQTVESSGLELKILRPWCPRPDKRGGDTINHILWLRHQCYWLFNVYLTTQHFLVALRLRDHELLGATGLPSAEREGARQHEGVHQRHHQPAAGHRPGPTLLLSVPGPGHSDLAGAGVGQPRVVSGGAALVLPLGLRLPALAWTSTSEQSAQEWVKTLLFNLWQKQKGYRL